MATAECAACGGSQADHAPGKTQHAYTERAGELITHEQMAKRNAPPQQPTVVRLGQAASNSAGADGRLTEVLLELGVIKVEHALYIAGMGSKPPAPSGFRDPSLGGVD